MFPTGHCDETVVVVVVPGNRAAQRNSVPPTTTVARLVLSARLEIYKEDE